jgi:hypothetical protein
VASCSRRTSAAIRVCSLASTAVRVAAHLIRPIHFRTPFLHIRLSEVARWSDLPSSRGAVLPAAAADRSHQSAPFQRVSSPARARPWTTARRLNVNCIQADMQDTLSIYESGPTLSGHPACHKATDNTRSIRTTPAIQLRHPIQRVGLEMRN